MWHTYLWWQRTGRNRAFTVWALRVCSLLVLIDLSERQPRLLRRTLRETEMGLLGDVIKTRGPIFLSQNTLCNNESVPADPNTSKSDMPCSPRPWIRPVTLVTTHKSHGRLLQEEVSTAVKAVWQRVIQFTLIQTPVRQAWVRRGQKTRSSWATACCSVIWWDLFCNIFSDWSFKLQASVMSESVNCYLTPQTSSCRSSSGKKSWTTAQPVAPETQ